MKNASFIIGLAVLLSSQTGFATDNIVISSKQIQSLGITTAALPDKHAGEISGLPAQVVIPGNRMYVISTPLAAMVEQTLVGVGDNVKKGQIIARLQSPALAEAQRGLLQATVQSQLARENLTRDESLYKDGIISESRYRTTRGLALDAQASLSERKSMLHLSGMSDGAISKLQSGNNTDSLLTITSPIEGVVLEKSASAGQRLDAAVPIFKIAKIDQLTLEIQAPLSAVRDLEPAATITVPAYAASGKLTAIGRSLTGTNQTILLRGIILHGSENLRPGQFVEVSISTSTHSGAQWEIPNSAISHVAGKTVLFIATPQGFHVQAINILSEGAANSVISGALRGDERIAVRGVSSLKASLIGIGGGE